MSHRGRPLYQSYLVRLWRESSHAPWRAAVQSTATGERHTFADVAGLLAYLRALTQDVPSAPLGAGPLGQAPWGRPPGRLWR